MLEFEIEQPFGVSSKGGIEAFEKDETWNKYEITVNLNSNSNSNWKQREENEKFVENPSRDVNEFNNQPVRETMHARMQ